MRNGCQATSILNLHLQLLPDILALRLSSQIEIEFIIVRRNRAVMVAAHRASLPTPPPRQAEPIINGNPLIQHWLMHYWQKLQLPTQELSRLAITQDRREFMRWTGKRLNIMVLGCYCYLPALPVPRARSYKHGPSQARSGLHADTASRLDTSS